ncbi:hypothetical protein DVDV_2682 [Desulfovibrio sp. DV]|nr:hypothetical protein DVDV_2682 [Desulfovibrio sp. DV]
MLEVNAAQRGLRVSFITKTKNEVTIFTKAVSFIVTQVLQLVTSLAGTVNRQFLPNLSAGCVWSTG